MPIGPTRPRTSGTAGSSRREGNGAEWARAFAVTTDDRELIWSAIAQALTSAPVSAIRHRTPYGVVAGVELTLTIRGRNARVVTSWHYVDEDAAPRLVTAYPSA